jgi:demethylmenaquinone methyltransferase/2-methoxy-6-polyprenyl-1,4-benzoquinol methylase
MFDGIARRYDFLNRSLSAGVDVFWRKKAIRLADVPEGGVVLDVACGTGDLSAEAKKAGAGATIGVDLSIEMLRLFADKRPWSRGATALAAAEEFPFADDSFDRIVVSFGVRNFYDLPAAFAEFRRTLKPGGSATILEFALPKNSVVRFFYRFYITHILPFVGGVVSGDRSAYRYLPESVEAFDRDVDLVALLEQAGFSSVKRKTVTFGVVQIVVAAT